MPKKKIPRPQAANTRLAALEAFAGAVELQASGKLGAARDAIQRAVEATKEGFKSELPWNKREQDELSTIIRGGAPSDADLSLGEVFSGPSPNDAQNRVREAIGWHKAIVGTMKSRSDTGREAKGGTENAQLNRKVEKALAEIRLRPGKGRGAVAMAHLKNNHFHAWTARDRRFVELRIKLTWFKDRMMASQKLRTKNRGGVRERAPSVNKH